MAVYVYQNEDGALVSWNADNNGVVASSEILKARGYSVVRDLPTQDQTHMWDAVTRTIIEVSGIQSEPITPDQFILRFTPQETAAIRSSSDLGVQQMLFAVTLAPVVHLDSERVQQGIYYLASIGLIAEERIAEILA